MNIITMTDAERSQINAGAGTNGYQSYDGAFNKRFGDTLVTAAGAYQTTKEMCIRDRCGSGAAGLCQRH